MPVSRTEILILGGITTKKKLCQDTAIILDNSNPQHLKQKEKQTNASFKVFSKHNQYKITENGEIYALASSDKGEVKLI